VLKQVNIRLQRPAANRLRVEAVKHEWSLQAVLAKLITDHLELPAGERDKFYKKAKQ